MKTPCRVDHAILIQMVNAYIRDYRDDKLEELKWYKNLRPHLDVAIHRIEYNQKNGKKHPHQWRVSEDKLDDLRVKLQAKNEENQICCKGLRHALRLH
jgi:hypothetical protein